MRSSNKIVITILSLMVSLISLARETTLSEAKAVVTGWSRGNGRGFGATGAVTGGWSVKDAAGTVIYHMVTTKTGAVAVAADTDIEPIIAYLPGSNGKLPDGHPMKAMLEWDMSSRVSIFRTVPSTTSSVLKLSTSSLSTSSVSRGEALEASAEKSNTKWTKLTSDSKRLVLTTSALDPEGNPPTIIRWLDEWNVNGVGSRAGQLRVWNQSNSSHFATNGQIFNRYTPNNYVCGCVATAGASVLHYWETPKGEEVSKTCTVDGAPKILTTSGINYNWSLLNDTLKWDVHKTLSTAQVEVLGRAASDMGIAVEMGYTSGASSAYVTSIATAMRDVFGFGSARATAQIIEGYDKSVFEPLIYNQVRAGLPVVMGIFGDGGHAVVACGYGEDDGEPYTYVFTGWGGEGDAWYALPNIETKSTWGGELANFNIVAELTTMAAPDTNCVAVVGEVVDPTGFLIDDDEVSFTLEDGSYLEATNGYFATRVLAEPGTHKMVCNNSSEVFTYTIKNEAAAPSTYPRWGENAYTLAKALPPAMTLTISSGILKTYTDWNAAQREAIRSGRPIVALQGAKGSSIVRQVRNTLRKVYENDEVASSNFIESVVFYYRNKRQNGFGVVDPRKFDGTTFGRGPAFFNYDALADADPDKWRDMLTNGVENVWYATSRALTNIVVNKEGDEALVDVNSDITNRSFTATLMFEDNGFVMSNANLIVDWAVTNTGYGISIDNNGIATIGYAAKGTNTVVAAGEFKANLETEYKHLEGTTNLIIGAYMNFDDSDVIGRENADYIVRNSSKNSGYGVKIYSNKVSKTVSTYRRVEKTRNAIFYCTGVRVTDVTTGEEITNVVITTGKDNVNNKEILSIRVPKDNNCRVEWQWKTIAYYLDLTAQNCIVDTTSGWVEPDVTKTITATLPSEYDIAIWQGQGIPTTTNLTCEVLMDAPKSVKVYGLKREALPKPDNAVEELLPAPKGYLAKAYYDKKGNFIGTSWELDPQVQNSANAGALAIENNTVNLKIPNAIAGFTYKLLRCDLGSNKTTEEQAIKATKDGPITLSAPCSGSSGFYKILVIP